MLLILIEIFSSLEIVFCPFPTVSLCYRHYIYEEVLYVYVILRGVYFSPLMFNGDSLC